MEKEENIYLDTLYLDLCYIIDIEQITVNVLKFWTLYSLPFLPEFCSLFQLFLKILSEKANSVDPDQTAPSGAVWSGSALFAYAILLVT